jgi:hypothetical protein
MDSNQHDHDESADTETKRPADSDVVARESGKTTPERSGENQRQRQLSKRHNRGPPLDDDDEPVERIADDVLLGAKRIAEHLASILGVPVDETDVYYAHRMKKWPIGKYGALLIASKRRFARHVEEITRGSTAA